MTPTATPAALALWELVRTGVHVRFGPLSLSWQNAGVDLRQCQDAAAADGSLRSVDTPDLRALAQLDALGRFRPNKAAVQTGSARAVSWQEFADRQRGMYRHVSSLLEPEAEQVARAGCHPGCCLRRRLWKVGERECEAPAEKTMVPCLEPCALVLELARREQKASASDERAQVTLNQGELALLDRLFDLAIGTGDPLLREGDLGDPLNPRRVLMLREKLLPWLPMREWTRPG
ncbi:MAG: hypothetical protein LW626_11915 [Verrucomicrobium sp.]|nr:hypothetical protein [Verrucomicrobium sp.]